MPRHLHSSHDAPRPPDGRMCRTTQTKVSDNLGTHSQSRIGSITNRVNHESALSTNGRIGEINGRELCRLARTPSSPQRDDIRVAFNRNQPMLGAAALRYHHTRPIPSIQCKASLIHPTSSVEPIFLGRDRHEPRQLNPLAQDTRCQSLRFSDGDITGRHRPSNCLPAARRQVGRWGQADADRVRPHSAPLSSSDDGSNAPDPSWESRCVDEHPAILLVPMRQGSSGAKRSACFAAPSPAAR